MIYKIESPVHALVCQTETNLFELMCFISVSFSVCLPPLFFSLSLSIFVIFLNYPLSPFPSSPWHSPVKPISFMYLFSLYLCLSVSFSLSLSIFGILFRPISLSIFSVTLSFQSIRSNVFSLCLYLSFFFSLFLFYYSRIYGTRLSKFSRYYFSLSFYVYFSCALSLLFSLYLSMTFYLSSLFF